MTPEEYKKECEKEARDLRRAEQFDRKGLLYAIQALALCVVFVIGVVIVTDPYKPCERTPVANEMTGSKAGDTLCDVMKGTSLEGEYC